jgi:hypothetical protein
MRGFIAAEAMDRKAVCGRRACCGRSESGEVRAEALDVLE